jgi:UDP-N-acetylmuramyl pentapeptide phosphotransferase/UDP-N-acetylglucosamine-1-phosphate transferase
MWGDIAIAFLIAFMTAYVLTPYTIRFSNKIGAVDIPESSRKIHKYPMPRLRWTSYYCWFFSIYNLFNNCYEFRKSNKHIRSR